MVEPKIPAFGAIAGFVLSLLTGLFSGAGFSLVLLRAFGIAALFAALAFLLAYVLKTFLPDLFMPLPDPAEYASSERDTDFGSVVNLTVGDSDVMPFESRTDSDTSGTLPDFLQAPKDDFAGTSDFGDRLQTPDAHLPVPDRPVPVGKMDTGARPPKASKGVGGLDSLPDLQDFIPDVAPEAVDDGESLPDTIQGKREPSFSTSELSGAGIESETMAKAIRTILSRDK